MCVSGKQVVWSGGVAHILDGVDVRGALGEYYVCVGGKNIKIGLSSTGMGSSTATTQDIVDLLGEVLDELVDQGRLK